MQHIRQWWQQQQTAGRDGVIVAAFIMLLGSILCVTPLSKPYSLFSPLVVACGFITMLYERDARDFVNLSKRFV